MNSLTYPDGRMLIYSYGTSGSATDRLDRVASFHEFVNFVKSTLVTYQYTGAGTLVTQTYNEPGISKTLLTESTITQSDDPYTALDRFGRMVDLQWKKSSSDLVRFKYGYDRVSNRLFERNTISTGSNPAIDSLLGYDELNRMIDFKTGLLNTAGDAISSPVSTQTFTLDETGNISRNALASGSTTTLDQTRSHNTVNEITDIDETVGATWSTPAFNDAGNMTTIPQPNALTASYTLTWDAWNRLISVTESSTTVATYRYDGTNRRIIKNKYVSGSLSETRHVYYSLQAQPLEERVGSSTAAEKQFVWNVGYVDDLVFRDGSINPMIDPPYVRLYALSDLRFSIVALADDAGTIVERFAYDAHGRSSVMDSSFAARSSSSYDWEFRYTGRRLDLETGLYYFRARYYHAELGRFISRDPMGFVDGMSFYRGYFVPNYTDPKGTSCSVTPCIQRCGTLSNTPRPIPNPMSSSGWPVGSPMGPSDRQSCIQGCRDAARRFLKWFDDQMRQGKPNYGNLPACPCSISCKKTICAQVFMVDGHTHSMPPVTVDTVCAPKGWTLGYPAAYPVYLPTYHPGAVWDLRSQIGPAYTQCTYDKDGKLITTGPGIGTVDEGKAPYAPHPENDVHPVDDIIILEGGKLTGGCWFNMYKRMRPLINRNKCPRNP